MNRFYAPNVEVGQLGQNPGSKPEEFESPQANSVKPKTRIKLKKRNNRKLLELQHHLRKMQTNVEAAEDIVMEQNYILDMIKKEKPKIVQPPLR